MTEIEFEQALVELAHVFGWHVAAFRPASTSKGWRTPVKYDGKGWPDLCLVHERGYIIFAELKAEKGKLSDEQTEWAEILASAAGQISQVHYHLWKPSMANEIAKLLSFGAVTNWSLTNE
jgi:nicotinamidase-related amidase